MENSLPNLHLTTAARRVYSGGMSIPNPLALAMIGMALEAPRSRPYGDGEPVMRPGRSSQTKTYENTADARKRKKAERQNKKQGRKNKR